MFSFNSFNIDIDSYHLYLFKHTHEGDYLESIVFIYSMPGYSCPVKERMMYSSVKATFCETIQKLGLDIAKRVSVGIIRIGLSFVHKTGDFVVIFS